MAFPSWQERPKALLYRGDKVVAIASPFHEVKL